jgi:hypothetical protein
MQVVDNDIAMAPVPFGDDSIVTASCATASVPGLMNWHLYSIILKSDWGRTCETGLGKGRGKGYPAEGGAKKRERVEAEGGTGYENQSASEGTKTWFQAQTTNSRDWCESAKGTGEDPQDYRDRREQGRGKRNLRTCAILDFDKVRGFGLEKRYQDKYASVQCRERGEEVSG